MPLPWFDAHLDLAYLAVAGRDMSRSAAEVSKPDWSAGLTLPELRQGGVRFVLGTIFTEVGGTGPEGYPVGDAERAFAVGRAQLEVYFTWRDRGLISLDRFGALRAMRGLSEVRGGMGVAETVGLSSAAKLARLPKQPAIHLGILMENADPIRSPEELGWWKERGLVAVGLTWAKSSRYAGGNGATEGLSDVGRDMVRAMDRLGIVHDASHLSDRSFADLCETTGKLIMASHSNCRAITNPAGTNQRHLTDAQIREIVRRGGVIGINLYSKFLRANLGENDRASIDDCLAHIDHICSLAGSKRHVALGSDMDGGFPASRMPAGIDRPADYHKLAERLAERGWSDSEVLDFAAGNWMRIFG